MPPKSNAASRNPDGGTRVYPSRCLCGCGRTVTDWMQDCYPQPKWDTPGLPPRRMHERCANHYGSNSRGTANTVRTVLCAYRDDDPARCPQCHRRYGLPNGCGKSERCRGAA